MKLQDIKDTELPSARVRRVKLNGKKNETKAITIARLFIVKGLKGKKALCRDRFAPAKNKKEE